MSDKSKFWLVWSPRGKWHGWPSKKHESVESAQAEALRLAAKFHGRHFYVMEMIGYEIIGEPLSNKKERALAADPANAAPF